MSIKIDKEQFQADLEKVLRPSSFHRLLACPASIVQSFGLAGKSSEAAERGTKMHGYLEQLVFAYNHNGELPEGVALEDDLDDFEQVVRLFNKFMSPERFTGCELVKGRYKLASEQRREMALDVGDGVVCQIGGTADLELTWAPAGTTDIYLEIGDLKTGTSPVNPEDNTQLIPYAYWKMQKMPQKPVLVALTILQGDEIKTTTYAGEEIEEKAIAIFERLKANVTRSEEYSAGSHCRYCPVNQHLKCPIQNEKSLAVFDNLTETSSKVLTELSDAQIERIAQIKMSEFETFVRKVKALALKKYQQSPKSFPGLKLVRSVTRRQVADKEKLIAEFGEMVTLTTLKPLKDLERELGPDVLEQYTVKPEGKLEVASIDDRRQAVAELVDEEIFK